MTCIFVDKKGFHKSIVMPNAPPTYNIPWKMFNYNWNPNYVATDMVSMQYSTFRFKNMVDGTDHQVALYEEI